MPEGDLITLNHQYEFRSLLLGSTTAYIVEEVQGLWGLPGVRDNDLDRQDTHGVFPGRDLLTGRSLILEIKVDGASSADVESKMLALANSFQISQIEDPFVFKKPFRNGKERINCRTRRRVASSDYKMAHGLATVAIELYASDPRIYDNVLTETSEQIDTGTSSVDFDVTNSGNFPTPPVITIVGPATDPRIQNNSDGGKTIKLDLVLGAAETLVIDAGAKTVTVDGDDRYDVVETDNEWWQLAAGVNEIVYNRTGTGAASTIEVAHRHAWIL